MLRLSQVLAAVVALALLASTSSAAAQTFPTDELSAVTFRPAPGAQRYLMVEGAQVGHSVAPSAGVMFDYAYRPLYIRTFCEDPDVRITCDINAKRVAIVEHVAAAHLSGAWSFADRVEIGLSVPVLYASGEGFAFRREGDEPGEVSPGAVRGGSGAGVGDPRLSIQARVAGGATDPAALAVVAWATAPLGQATMEGRYTGDRAPNVGAHGVAEFYARDLRAALLLGAYYRPEAGLIGIDVGPMLSYGAAVEWRATSIASLVAEITGATSFGAHIDQLEGRAAAELRAGDVELTAGAGVGLVRGPGVPYFRALGGLRWAPLPEGDQDADGIPDRWDACPEDPEDRDGFADDDGCPDGDNDGDGLPDAVDRCPDEPEDRDGHDDEDGCPDRDDDGDRIEDGYDSCPNEPEDYDGDRDEDGCPDNDRDEDGVQDDVDQCPDVPEDTDGLMDDDGCPEDDADGDGVPDEDDVCPDTPGTDCHEPPADAADE